jgi:hypothetical protein
MQFCLMLLETRGETTIVWFDRLTRSVAIGPTRRPLLRHAISSAGAFAFSTKPRRQPGLRTLKRGANQLKSAGRIPWQRLT